jgi:hypothetical protein
MGPLVNEESYRMSVNGNFEYKIRWGTRLNCRSGDAIVMGVDESFVKI